MAGKIARSRHRPGDARRSTAARPASRECRHVTATAGGAPPGARPASSRLTLPSGIAVEIRAPRLQDVVRVFSTAPSDATREVHIVLGIVSRIARFDGRRLSPDEISGLDYPDFVALFDEHVVEPINALLRSL